MTYEKIEKEQTSCSAPPLDGGLLLLKHEHRCHVVESQAPSLDTQVDEYKYYALEVVLLPLK